MTTTLRGRAFVSGAIHDDVTIVFDEAGIESVEVNDPARVPASESVIVPGFVDIHVHGAAGADFMDATGDAVAAICAHHADHGTAALAATTLSGSREAIGRAVSAIARHEPGGGAEIVGIHMEGPYLDPSSAGAQDRASIRPPDGEELEQLLSLAPGLPWIVTIAPEIAGAVECIARFRDRARFSIGHTRASFGDAVVAVNAGASQFTHLFNAMTGLHHREPGAVGAALASPDTIAELIADGIHVHPAVLRIAALAMPDRIALVTDAMRACGMPPGTYRLYDYEVQVDGGAARLPGGTLAGSVLTMLEAVRNMVELAGLPLAAVLPLATEVPARAIGCAGRKGRIAPGFDADLLVLSPRLTIERAFLRGRERPR